MSHDTLEYLPSGWTGDLVDDSPGWGWASRILPFMEQGNLYDSISFDQPINHPDNASIVTTVVPSFLCPSDAGAEVIDMEHTSDHGGHAHLVAPSFYAVYAKSAEFVAARGNYSGVFGISAIEDNPDAGEGVYFRNSRVTFAQIRDGLSHTFMIGERSSELGGVTWLGVVNGIDEPMARILGSADHAPNDPSGHFEDFRSYHASGANFATADGSVHLINEAIDLRVYQAAATRQGHEIPGEF
jgi:prepilin-type processing-associated H-X9-DG protein